jgi:molybdopterin-guanine dinucleotide biosynthesis protein A
MELSAVILAGGESRRMGRDKAWLHFDGKPLVKLAVEKVRQLGIKEVFISGRAGEDYSALECPVLFDLKPGFGPVGGIERGLHECRSPLLLVLAVDLPHMSLTFLKRMRNACDRLTGAVPKLKGQLEPLAGIYPKRCLALAFAAIAKSQHSARDFASACLRERAVRACSVSRGEASVFLNWNRPGDLANTGASELE